MLNHISQLFMEAFTMSAKRILYIEDDFQNRRLVRKLLRLNGFEMIEAEDGLQGIAIAAREKPDLILMDINLPGIDGMEATSRLKSSDDLSHIPIIAVTANAMRGDRERIMEAGCDSYLQKPINTVKLMELVTSFIGAGQPVPSVAPAVRVAVALVAKPPVSTASQPSAGMD
jgi:two-component system cell cycle response regulator DivK